MATLVKYALRVNQAAWDGMSQTGYTGWVATISAWWALIPSDMVTADEYWQLDCYDDWPSGLDDNFQLTSKTMDVDCAVRITSPPTERHNGVFGGGFSIAPLSGYPIEILTSGYITIDNIEINRKSTSLGEAILSNNSWPHIYIDSCIILNASSGNTIYLATANADSYIRNSILKGGDRVVRLNVAADVLNCTITDAGNTGIVMDGGDIKNNIITNAALSFSGTYNEASNNADDNGTDTGSAITLSIGTIGDIADSDFNDAPNDDYSLSVGSSLIDEGSDLSGVFTDDIAGTTRG